MKKILLLFSISISLLSCQKQKHPSIIGGWIEIEAYTERGGQYSWGPPSTFSLKFIFREDGKYSAYYDVSGGLGNYTYDYSSRTLHLETTNPQSTNAYTVTYLNDHYMVIEFTADHKLKFARLY